MLRMLESQAPAKQNATDTINTLCSRLNNATLLEDRRAAILGLRSFAKEYPASVASGSLRALIGCLTKDLEDVDTIKVVLETLLLLFKPNADSPEAGEEITLWLADEFTQRQDNIKILLNLVETADFYSSLYSLQLLSAIYAARPERTQECVLSPTLGTSQLVTALRDGRGPVQNAALLLLSDLTESSPDLQQLVVFDNAFEPIFDLLDREGGLRDGGIIIQDCLDLLANLVRQNSINQTQFRESPLVGKIPSLLKAAYAPSTEGEDVSLVPDPQRDKNVWGLLAVIRLFLVKGSPGTQLNQKKFEKTGLLQQVLDLAFGQATDVPIRAEALFTCADIIRSNPELQESFALHRIHITGPPTSEKPVNGAVNGTSLVYIIDALLDLVIANTSSPFNLRFAACETIKAYFLNHDRIRHHFLNRAIGGHNSGEDETANILSTVLREGVVPARDPFRVWFATTLLFHLIWQDVGAKGMLMSVLEGDAESGEEVVTCIQTISGNLIAGIHRKDDERVLIGYLTLLAGWLFEDSAAVNDFLDEGSTFQSLIQVIQSNPNSAIVPGLSALLLGIIYEYSTKDSPIPRRKLQPLLTSGLGRERYLQTLSQFRQHPLIRDYEVFTQDGASALPPSEFPPYSYFDATFVEFLKDNFSRFSRAIDRDPGIEIQVSSGEEGIDRDLVDSLRSQLEGKVNALQQAENQLLELEQKLGQEQANRRKDSETSNVELQRIKQVNESLQQSHEVEIQRVQAAHSAEKQSIQVSSTKQIQELNEQLQSVRKSTSEEAARTKEYHERTLAQIRASKANTESRLEKTQQSITELSKSLEESRKTAADLQSENSSWKRGMDALKSASQRKDQQLAEFKASLTQQTETAEDEKTKVSMLEKEVSDLELQLKEAKAGLEKAQKEATEKEEARAAAQVELDDTLMVLADSEEKRAGYKKRLKALGEDVSDADDDEDEEEDGDDDVD